MQLTQWLLKKVDKEAGCVCVNSFMCSQHLCMSFLCLHVWGRWACVFLCITPGSTSYHCFIMEECLGSFITEPGCSGDLGAGGPAQRAPMMLKRWQNWKESRDILLVFVCVCMGEREGLCVCKSQEGRTQESSHRRIVFPACHRASLTPSIGE